MPYAVLKYREFRRICPSAFGPFGTFRIYDPKAAPNALKAG